QAASRYRTGASRALVDGLILQESAFHDDSGRFSEDRYRQLLFRAGLNPLAYRESLASDIRRQHLLSPFAVAGLETDAGFRQALRLLRQTRDVRYILLPREPFEAAVELSEEAVVAYYDSHQQDFL